MIRIKQQISHQWEPMKEFLMGQENLMAWMEDRIEGKLDVIRKLPLNNYVYISRGNNSNSIRRFNLIIEEFKRHGLDIGRGESMYGYKMPLPKEGDPQRHMIIFRRKI